jgi:hypothetical protein
MWRAVFSGTSCSVDCRPFGPLPACGLVVLKEIRPLVCRVADRRSLTPSSSREALGTAFLLPSLRMGRASPVASAVCNALPSRASCSLVLAQKVTHAGAFRYPGRQLIGIGRLETGSAICAFGVDGAFEGCGADLPTLSFCAKRSQHQRRLHLRNIGAEEPKHRKPHLPQVYR